MSSWNDLLFNGLLNRPITCQKWGSIPSWSAARARSWQFSDSVLYQESKRRRSFSFQTWYGIAGRRCRLQTMVDPSFTYIPECSVWRYQMELTMNAGTECLAALSWSLASTRSVCRAERSAQRRTDWPHRSSDSPDTDTGTDRFVVAARHWVLGETESSLTAERLNNE